MFQVIISHPDRDAKDAISLSLEKKIGDNWIMMAAKDFWMTEGSNKERAIQWLIQMVNDYDES